jgi:hypothetical protein
LTLGRAAQAALFLGIRLSLSDTASLAEQHSPLEARSPFEFSLDLPMNPHEGLRVAADSKVLLVEDSKLLRMASERALSKPAFEVSTAADGEEALQSVRDDRLTSSCSTYCFLSQKNEERLVQEGATAYFEKSALELDKSSDRFAATVKTVLRQVNHQKGLQRQLKEAAIKRAAAEAHTTEEWEIEVAAVESTACTTTIPQPPSKS